MGSKKALDVVKFAVLEAVLPDRNAAGGDPKEEADILEIGSARLPIQHFLEFFLLQRIYLTESLFGGLLISDSDSV